jgi:GT2 family glycosyltransferase
VIPTFSRPRETGRALRSALAQDGVAVEVIVVDDGSATPLRLPDDLAGRPEVRLIRLPRNGGAAAARNAGVEAAAGACVAFLDSDDFFLPGTLADRLSWLRRRQVAAPTVCVAPVWRWAAGGPAVLSEPQPTADLAALASGCWYFPGSTALFARSTWEATGPLDPSLRRLEDLDWGIRLGQAGGQIVCAPMPAAVVHRSRPAGSAAVDAAARRLAGRFAPSAPVGLPPRVYRRLLAYLALERANSALGEGRTFAGAAELARSFLWRPRLSPHQGRWWRERPATPEEAAAIETLAAQFAA